MYTADMPTMILTEQIADQYRDMLFWSILQNSWLIKNEEGFKKINTKTLEHLITNILENMLEENDSHDVQNIIALLKRKKFIRYEQQKSINKQDKTLVRCANCKLLIKNPYGCMVNGEGMQSKFGPEFKIAARKCRDFIAVELEPEK